MTGRACDYDGFFVVYDGQKVVDDFYKVFMEFLLIDDAVFFYRVYVESRFQKFGSFYGLVIVGEYLRENVLV